MPSKSLGDCLPALVEAFNKLHAEFKRAHPLWQMLVVCTYRPPVEQFVLFQKGRKEVDGKWVVVDEKAVVTNKDGTKLRSRHNDKPARAIDVELYHPNGKKFWDTKSAGVEVGDDVVKNPWLWLRDHAGEFGLLNGGSWVTPNDFPHFQLR